MNFDDTIYEPSEVISVLKMINKPDVVADHRGIKYLNMPSAFDIETSSFMVQTSERDKSKAACMYLWQICIYDKVIQGRTWDQWLETLCVIANYYKLTVKRRLIMYVHFLSYEFQWIRKRLRWYKIFAIKNREPLYAVSDLGIEFRDSYILTALSLQKVGENLIKYKVKKLVGDLNYDLVRHSSTPLTEKERMYGANDVKVICACIQEKIESDGNITKIPLTNTGYVRNFFKENTITGNSYSAQHYRKLISSLTLNYDEYYLLKQCFAGGYTHASQLHVDELLINVSSYDFTSAYPSVMVSEKAFPMSKGEEVFPETSEEFFSYIKEYCCVFDITLFNVASKTEQDFYISKSKCIDHNGLHAYNGRVTGADMLRLVITEVDFTVIHNVYDYDTFSVNKMYIYKRGYLPTSFVKGVLDLYEAKTKLKGVVGKEEEFLRSKGMANASYGLTVMDPVRTEFEYEEEWRKQRGEVTKYIDRYNSDRNRCLFYAWGIYITALVRRNLWTAVCSSGFDHIYSDTDSEKVLNNDLHKEYFERYNNNIVRKMEHSMAHHNFPDDKYKPMNKILGVWDFEGTYQYFKTLGAKRYLTYNKDGDKVFSLTFAGVNKISGARYLLDSCDVKYHLDELSKQLVVDDDTNIVQTFEMFTLGNDSYPILSFPYDYAGRQASLYIDDQIAGSVTDYLGNTNTYNEKSCINLTPTRYDIKANLEYHEDVDLQKVFDVMLFNASDSIENFEEDLI